MPAFNLNKVFITGEIADVSTASAVRIPITDDLEGEVVEVRTVLGGAIATADSIITVSNKTASMGTITVANASSAEGDIDTLNPTDADRFVNVGDWIKVATGGQSTNTVPLGFTIVIKR